MSIEVNQAALERAVANLSPQTLKTYPDSSRSVRRTLPPFARPQTSTISSPRWRMPTQP